MPSGKLAMVTAALLLSSAVARADVEISSKPTSNMSCVSGVCTATVQKAVLNVGDLQAMLASGDVAVKTALVAKDIDIDQPLQWTSTRRLTLDAQRSIVVKKVVTVAGTAGLTLTTNDGGSGGDLLFENKGSVTFWDTNSSLIINGQSYTLVKDIATLAADIAADPSGLYALANSYDAKHDRFENVPIATPLSGTFEGLGQTITHLKIRHSVRCGLDQHDPSRCEGLFNATTSNGVLSDLTIVKADVRVSDVDTAGILVGTNLGTIKSVSVSGSVGGSATYLGGIVGNSNGQILDANSAAAVSGSTADVVGGLAGFASTISNSYASGPVVGAFDAGGLAGAGLGFYRSYATGAVSVLQAGRAGGLVGSGSTISQCYATGSVQGLSDSSIVGGLAGNITGIVDSYALGSVEAGRKSFAGGLVGRGDLVTTSYSSNNVTAGNSSKLGGFIGKNIKNLSLTSDYWNLDPSGLSQGCGKGDCSGVTGLTTAQFQAGLPNGFDPKIWKQDSQINGGLPFLAALMPN